MIVAQKREQLPTIDLVSHIMTLRAFDPVYKEPQTPAFHHYFRDLKISRYSLKGFLGPC